MLTYKIVDTLPVDSAEVFNASILFIVLTSPQSQVELVVSAPADCDLCHVVRCTRASCVCDVSFFSKAAKPSHCGGVLYLFI